MRHAPTWPAVAAAFALLCGTAPVWLHHAHAAQAVQDRQDTPEAPVAPETPMMPAPPGEPEGNLPPEAQELLPKDVPDDAANRRQLLGELYERLSRSGSEDDAKVFASAIEKLWLRSGSDTVDLLMARTAKLMQEKDFDLALEILDSIVEIAPEYPEGWTRRAAIHFVQKDFGESLQDLRHALALDPKHYKAIQGLGLLLQEMGENEAALQTFRELLKVHPHLDEAQQAVRELKREVEGQGI